MRLFTYKKLRGRIYEKYSSLSDFAKALGTSVTYVSNRLHSKSNFTKASMDKWAAVLEIPLEQYVEYFFT